ncbi:HlyD family secretion protein [Dyadobacter frigoris]|uniref:HlyD family efflux transporter periplasmic adaptor subunit n=1 Tax=Dyadobacter frigoris TaxID=2576211 RepID=A0A4U6D2H8_9BACT|nr:HlyD family efflux transporter periplasmic adaptor subunit [Dyadobacter frigoris]TKT91372.1 HlyD family efflux transporter periplasmic adaptor subunit [Dyadobacter frigoris]GLU56386.1 HlyD family type I secretion periplasmic adaptor subunit [Dyadobacter frigoris]
MQHKPQVLPPEFIETSLECYLPKVDVRSQAIYCTLIALVLGILISLPFLYVDISVKSIGEIRAISEKTEVKPLIGGEIKVIEIHENQYVRRGQSLLSLKTDILDSKLRFNALQQTEKNSFIQDLSHLVSLDSAGLLDAKGFVSSLYGQQYSQFKYNLLENILHLNKELKELNADRGLYQHKVMPIREYDAKEFEYNKLTAAYRLLKERQISSWQGDLNTHKATLSQLEAEQRQLLEEKKNYSVLAPISGTIQHVSGKYSGSYLSPGESLCIISPNDSLLAECYVTPSDIGFLKTGMAVNFQIDAFNYNEWGMLQGQIINISDDYILIQNKPIFKVKCLIKNLTLKLRKGHSTKVKKGMTFQARFLVTRRSLYQLVYDKGDDWLNPVRRNEIL